jgi:hypothetical protein
MDSCLGDVHFIRRLHHKIEIESGELLKRYVKAKRVRYIISQMQNSKVLTKASVSGSGSPTRAQKEPGGHLSLADLHAVLDELAVLVQYCESYRRYLRTLCHSAETATRQGTQGTGQIVVFGAGTHTEFDGILAEIVNTFYLPIEIHIINAHTVSCMEGLSGTVAAPTELLEEGKIVICSPVIFVTQMLFTLV